MIGQAAKIAGTCGKAKASAPAKMVGTSSGHSRLRSIRPAWTSGRVEVVRAAASSRAIGGLVSLRRPRASPTSAAAVHHAAAPSTSRLRPSLTAPATVTAARTVAPAAEMNTVAFRKSVKRTVSGSLSSPSDQRFEERPDPVGALDGDVGVGGDGRGALVGDHADPDGVAELALVAQLGQGAEGVEVGGVVAGVDGGVDVGVGEEVDDPHALVHAHGGADLEDLAPPVGGQTGLLGLPGHLLDGGAGRVVVGGSAPVEGHDRPLVLAPDAQIAQVRRVDLAAELADPPDPALDLGLELR